MRDMIAITASFAIAGQRKNATIRNAFIVKIEKRNLRV
jgi:hypothetical protein